MLNRVVLVGRLTRDPDLRYTGTGVAVANFTLAVGRPFTNQEGNRETDFINCVVWRRPAENLANYMRKGSQVGVDGRLQSRSYEDNDGKTVYVTEVVADSVQFLEPKSATQSSESSPQTPNQHQGQGQGQNQFQNQNQHQGSPQQSPANPFQNEGKPIDISDDDLPF